jgi:hypothetical protein
MAAALLNSLRRYLRTGRASGKARPSWVVRKHVRVRKAPLWDAIFRAGGFRISDGFISPLDLVQIGLATAERPRNCTKWSTRQACTDGG